MAELSLKNLSEIVEEITVDEARLGARLSKKFLQLSNAQASKFTPATVLDVLPALGLDGGPSGDKHQMVLYIP